MSQKTFRVAEARARFGEILDEAEQGSTVVIERHGVRFQLQAEKAAASGTPRLAFDFVDPAVLSGEWSWQPGRKGLRFTAARRRSAKRTRR